MLCCCFPDGASKHALQAFFDSLRAEVAQHGIGVSVVSPGYTQTNLSMTALTSTGDYQGGQWQTIIYSGSDFRVTYVNSLFRLPVSRRSIHQPNFRCSSHSPNTCPHPVLHIILPRSWWSSSVSLAFYFSLKL